MRNMISGRPDWCVSRQRSWACRFRFFIVTGCDEAVADAEIVYHVADIFQRETADAWYNREAKDLLPADFKCPKCGAADFIKETDILDVWFDSGSPASRFWKRARICNFRLTCISKAATSFAAGLTLR
jgi:isoleucyl-tRNA synthetase